VALIDARFGVAVFSIHAMCRQRSFALTPVQIVFQLWDLCPVINSSILEKLLIIKIRHTQVVRQKK